MKLQYMKTVLSVASVVAAANEKKMRCSVVGGGCEANIYVRPSQQIIKVFVCVC